MAYRQSDDLIVVRNKQTVTAYQERASPLLNKILERRRNFPWATCIREQQAHSQGIRRNLHLLCFGLCKNGISGVTEATKQSPIP
jgi:hypothetical protein